MTPQYVITCGDTLVLSKDKSVKECNNTNKQGLCLIEAWLLTRDFNKLCETWKFAIVFDDKETADKALKNSMLDLKEYFDREDWKVAKIETIHRLETEQEYPIYGE